jgi:cbb3-type cytochrome oxidase subunit 3
MSLNKTRRGTVDGLSLRGFAWAIGTAWLLLIAGANLLVTLAVTVFAYVKGA